MSATVLAAVLLGALLHAGWNVLIKSGRDATLDTALVHGLGAVVAVPVLLVTGLPDLGAWPYLVTSAFIHLGYYATLAGAYRHADLGLVYPVMRGTAPVLVALASLPLLGETLTPWAWMGVAAVSSGVFLLGMARAGAGAGPRRRVALLYALANAVIIMLYTLVDGQGARASGHPLAYVAVLFLLDGLPFLLIVLWLRRAQRPPAWTYLHQRWPWGLAAGAASMASYGLALWAMTQAPVALVAALRETSVLFAALLATWWLREPFGPARAAGTLAVLVGVMALRLA